MQSPAAPEPPAADQAAAAAHRRPIRWEGLARGWRAALREFAIIVAGVLCALAAQSWWQGSEERRREQDYLRQLLADTRENERRLDAAVAVDSAAGASVARLAGTLFGGEPLPPPDTLVAWFRGEAFASSDFQPLSGSYGALLMAGDLRLIRNDSLRALLVSYAAMLEHEQVMLRLFLEQAAGQPDRLARPMPFLRGMFFGGSAPGPGDIDFGRLRRDPDAESVFFAVQVSNANRITHLRRLREETRRLRRALAAELPARGGR
jgi:hypothetical protein